MGLIKYEKMKCKETASSPAAYFSVVFSTFVVVINCTGFLSPSQTPALTQAHWRYVAQRTSSQVAIGILWEKEITSVRGEQQQQFSSY